MRLLATVLIALGLGGCTTVIIPPAAVQDPATVYVVDMGYHASLLVPGGEGESLTEYAFGEWGWYAQGRRGWWRVPGIMLIPSPGALGRRLVEVDGVGLAAATGAQAVLPVVVERGRVRQWRAAMDAAWEARAAAGTTKNPSHPLEFVPWDERYWLLHTCNAAVAAWLRELGCEVRGPTVTAEFEVRPGG